MTKGELIAFLFTPPTSQAEEILTPWILQSRRFQAFLVEYRAKVRKKLRYVSTRRNMQSLLLELDIARQLVEDPRCQVEYEKYGQGNQRNPDLTITFRARTCFHLEATCIQIAQGDTEGRAEKLVRIVCTKLGQMLPQSLNCLIIATEGGSLTQEEVNAAMKRLKRRVEQRESDFLSHDEFDDPSGFFKQFQWLNGIVFSAVPETEDTPQTAIWINPQSRYPLPSDIRTLLQTTLSIALLP